MAPGHQSSQSSAATASPGEVAAPTLSFARIPLCTPSSDTASSAESMLWAPALDAGFRLPELSPSEAEAFKPSGHPEFDDCGVHSRYMQFHDESAPLPQAGNAPEEPDLVILTSTPPQERRCSPSPLRATLLPHAAEVTMPTIGTVGGFRRTRHSFQELTGSSPLETPIPRVQTPPQRPLTVADYATGVPYRYPPIMNSAPSQASWKRTAAARQYSNALYTRGAAIEATMPPGTSSARGYQYPRPPTTTPQAGLSFTPAVGESISSNQVPRQPSCSAARPPRNKNTAKQVSVRRTAAKKKERRSYVNDADALQKVESDLVRRVNAQSAYLKMLLMKNYEALTEASNYSSKL